jgi:NAD(P)-dependent dehydrogenase (short-subunit alcohol dehydrogenase family)
VETLEGRVGVVTGAASGIGLGLAHRFGAEHMRVVCVDIDASELRGAVAGVEEAGASEVLAAAVDVSDSAAVERLRDEIFDRFGTAHVVCNNAGIGGGGPTLDGIDLARWRQVIDVDMFGVLHGVQAFLPRLLEQGEGHIVNTSSRQGIIVTPGVGAYCMAKFGVVALSEVLDTELRAVGSPVGVSVLCPGAVVTGMTQRLRSDRDPALAAVLEERMASAVDPDDVAELVVRAIRERVLYVNTHAETLRWLEARTARIIADAEALGTLS